MKVQKANRSENNSTASEKMTFSLAGALLGAKRTIPIAISAFAIGIVFGIVTGSDNMFTRPEFSGGGNGRTWSHVGLHIVVIAMLPLITWMVGVPILWLTKKFGQRTAAIDQ